MTLSSFLKSRPYLIWYVKDISKVSTASAVEAVLNYGNWDDVQKLIKILGMKKTAKIFWEKSPKSKMGRTNYAPDIAHYFSLYFNKYAS
ncbi:MAG TPA: hypothetical protein DEB09_02115 [Candidatus Magasanikbacteria bacterium]|nr:hypothetical protein [Candidatus Magasanikbacteria bacterium]